MTRAKRNVVVSLAVLIGVPSLELVREEIAYLWVTKKLESAYEHFKPDMTREEVVRLAGMPDSEKKRRR